MLRRRIALSLALAGCILTILVGFISDVRPMTIGYRSLISLLVFGILGYLIGGVIETFSDRVKADFVTKGQNVDIVSNNDEDIHPSASGTSSPNEHHFSAFSSEQFEHIPDQH
ncbi:MAG: hypothetical protein P4N59_20410 [Negativicutes bacterium]|nr:hypothetical protein [Negativicutes bacterium]